MKIILTTGVGRLHFCEVNLALKTLGVERRMICGWLPSESQRTLLTLIGHLCGRKDIYERLDVRLMKGALTREDFFPMALPEFIAGVLAHIAPYLPISPDRVNTMAWKNFGRASKAYLQDADIFHVRSGAGQGGAIDFARQRGMKIIVDHSIAHPAYMHDVIGNEYQAFDVVNRLSHTSFFWKQVLRDCDQADLLLVNSDFVKRSFVEQGYPAEKIRVEYLGIPDYFYGAKTDWARVNPDRLELLYTGGFVLRKGIRSLFEALDHLRARGVKFRLTVAGDSSEAKRFFAAELAHPDIDLKGFIPRESLKGLIEQSDMYVFPTLSEGCAQSAMEALGAGLPVITTPACGLPGVPSQDYELIQANDPVALADGIEKLDADELLRDRYGKAGTKLLREKFTWDSYAQRLNRIYRSLI